MRRLALSLLGALAFTLPAAAQDDDLVARWSRPVAPFRILGNLYYVGTHEVTAFLITTPEGHVLRDGGLPETAPMIAASVEALGFELGETRLVAHKTPGHTPGCTTWTTEVEEDGERYHVVFVCSANALPAPRHSPRPGRSVAARPAAAAGISRGSSVHP